MTSLHICGLGSCIRVPEMHTAIAQFADTVY
jgi:hypothetical protein